ncbi:MAG: glycogen synthase [Sphingobacteriales bacterium BACL12 MAG-120802-bin5]|jgi:glycogen synthase|nr:MAG: glycogen synthase [Sphingobacteriales bacterium BACL12 MAG-120802-bin5]
MAKKSLYEPLLVEAAWEVCNQIGGIYTVVRSKVPYIVEKWGEQYCLVGPKLGTRLPAEFEESLEWDADDPCGKAVLAMRKMGYEVHYGRWLTQGTPKVVLMAPSEALPELKEIRQNLLTHHHINIFNPDDLLQDVILFGHLLYKFFAALEAAAGGREIIGHFHEWMTGMPIGDIERNKLKIRTVFTTHATMLGRYVAMNDKNFYRNLPSIEWLPAAQKFYIEPQVRLERLAAQKSTVFTTVSDVTGKECEFLLGRKPDMILPNGINLHRFIATHELQNLHGQFKEKIHEFTMSHFFHSYTFDLDDTVYFFTSGRYEYFNKGYDLTLEALCRLNERMKKENISTTVVMFFITKQPFESINPKVLQTRAVMDEIRETCEEILKQIREKLFKAAAANADHHLPELNEFVDDYWKYRYRKMIQSWKSDYWPIVVTHNLVNDGSDDIIKYLRDTDLVNKPDDRVKIIYHPDFVTPTNPLFGMDYPQFVRGCHLGIFPSYYEPWGYTPLECVARGVPAVTSDLSGFGDYCFKRFRNLEDNGIYIVKRRNKTFDESADQLAETMYSFLQLNRRDRIILRNTVESYAENFSWESLVDEYEKAYREVLS